MKRILIYLLIVAIALSCSCGIASADLSEGTPQAVPVPEISATAALIMDLDTGAVLYGKNKDQALPSADLTQIVTVLLGAEANFEGKTVTVTKEMLSGINKSSSHINLKEGEEILLSDLLYAVMLTSAADAANAIAFSLSGSISQFSADMVRKAQSLGAASSTFSTPDGLNADNKTTASDLALILRGALKNETFRTVFSEVSHKTAKTNKTNSYRTLSTLCHLLKKSETNAKYDSATGGKSGWSDAAGYTLAATAEKDGKKLLCIILGGSDSKTRYSEAAALFEYGFAAICNVTVPESILGANSIPVIDEGFITRKITLTMPQNTVLTLPVEYENAQLTVSALPAFLSEGFEQDELRVTISAVLSDGTKRVAGEVTLNYTVTEVFERNDTLGTENPVPQTTGAKIWNVVRIILIVLLIIIGVLILLAILMFLISFAQRRRRKARRRRKLEAQRKAEEEALNSAPTGRRHRKE